VNTYNQAHTFAEEETIDIKSIFFKVLRYWYLFVIFVPISFLCAFFYNRLSHPVYQCTTTVLIEDDKRSPSGEMELLEGFGLFSSKKNLENEISILKSYTLTSEAIKKIDFSCFYYQDTRYLLKELYTDSPFRVIIDSSYSQPVNLYFTIKPLSVNEYIIEAVSEEVNLYNYIRNEVTSKILFINFSEQHQFGSYITKPYCKFKVVLQDNIDPNKLLDNEYVFRFNNLNQLALKYKKSLTIEPATKEGTVVSINLQDKHAQKTTDFLNQFTQVYLEQNLEKKNRIAVNTIEFIDDQLYNITDSLEDVENKLETFRSSKKVLDLSFQAQQIYEKIQQLEGQRATLLIKSRFYNYIRDYFKNNDEITDLLAPSSLGIEDPLLNNLILELIQYSSKKEQLIKNKQFKNPLISTLNIKINNIKKLILENTNNLIQTNELALEDINERMEALKQEINALPRTERELLGIEREFKLNDAIYTLLLQRRAEAQIAKASNMPDNEVIDPATTVNMQIVSPNKRQNYLIGILMGFLLPSIFIFLKEYLNDTIMEKKDVERITQLPVLGYINHEEKTGDIIIPDKPKSIIAESFRALRTSLQYFIQGKSNQVILITSSISREGKTFNAVNLAYSFALLNKKTALVSFDLRKPKVHKDLHLDNSKGISTYLINKHSFKELIYSSNIPYLDIITGGPIPPNPAELIASEKTNSLFSKLKENYDYIIVDTSPVGIVTDARLLFAYSDIIVFIVRHKVTNKKIFSEIIQEIEKNNQGNVSILINDIKSIPGYYGYGYKYAYKYNYNYYNQEEKNNKLWIRKLFTKD
jgi:tyrosine-protein kinase Etk/Wzc